jgi:hypothetical protein
MTAEGGAFHNTMEKQSKSLSGLFSTLKDNIGFAARELVGITQAGDIKEGSLLARLKDVLNWLNDNLPAIIAKGKATIESIKPTLIEWAKNFYEVGKAVFEYLAPKIVALASTIKNDLFPALYNLWDDILKPLVPMLGSLLVVAIGAVIDIANILVHIVSFLAHNFEFLLPILAAAAAGFTVLKVSMAITETINAIIVGFNTLRLITIPSLIASFTALTAFLTTPLGIAVGLATITIGILTAGLLQQKSVTDQLKSAQDNLRVATDSLRVAQDNLTGANLNLEGAQLNVESAQRAYNDAVNQFGPSSLEARQALYNLEVAHQNVKRAQDDVKQSQSDLQRKEQEVAKDRQLVDYLQELKGNLDDVRVKAVNAGDQIKLLNGSKVTIKTTKGVVPGQDVIDFSSTFGGRAKGGPVTSNTPYIVGEKGPELFVPDNSGTIIPNDQTYSSGSHIENHINTINISSEVDGQMWLKKLTRDQEIIDNGLIPSKGSI